MPIRNEPMGPIGSRHRRTSPFSLKGILRNPRHAAEARHSEVVKSLLARHDVDIKTEDVRGDSPLHRAIRGEHPPIVRMPPPRQKSKLIQGIIMGVCRSH